MKFKILFEPYQSLTFTHSLEIQYILIWVLYDYIVISSNVEGAVFYWIFWIYFSYENQMSYNIWQLFRCNVLNHLNRVPNLW